MAFKPKNSNNSGGGNSGGFADRNFPVPKSGARKARISLIVDLGTQKRDDFEDPKTKVKTPQKPCQQVVVFADLVNDVVDYGGDIGKAQYRMLLNKSFAGVVQGVNFAAVPPKDAKGNLMEGKPWGFHPANLLTKIAKAVEKPEVIVSMDIEELLDQPLIVDVDVTEKDAEKEDKDGNPIIYKYVNAKGVSKVPTIETDDMDEDGNPIEAPAPVAELKQPALCITFENATADVIKFIRPNIIKVIKLAEDYAGSNMQKAIEQFEAEQAERNKEESGDDEEEEAPAPKETKKPAAKKTAAKAPAKKTVPVDDLDDDIPF